MTAVRIAKIDAEMFHESLAPAKNISILLLHHITECAEWNAVLLLIKTDVFLEQRSLHNIYRNGLISAFF